MKTVSMLVLLSLLNSSAAEADATQARCKEVEEDSKKRVYALIQHKDQWHLIYKSKSHPKWIRLPLLRYKPQLTESTLRLNYTSPLGGVRIKWSVRGNECSLFVSNAHELEVNDPDYQDLEPEIDEMNTDATLKHLPCEIGDLKIKLGEPSGLP